MRKTNSVGYFILAEGDDFNSENVYVPWEHKPKDRTDYNYSRELNCTPAITQPVLFKLNVVIILK